MTSPSRIPTPALYYSRVRSTLVPRIMGFTMITLSPVLFGLIVLIVLNNSAIWGPGWSVTSSAVPRSISR